MLDGIFLFVCVGLQVNKQMQTVSEELCACRKELETQTTALKRATHDREELAKDKAALDVKLNSADRKACGLTQELVALRSECVCACVCICLCGLTSEMFWTNFRFKPSFPSLFSAVAFSTSYSKIVSVFVGYGQGQGWG